MTKRPRDGPRHTAQKRRLVDADQVARSKRPKVFAYWHMAPLTRAEKAAHMAAIYEHLCRRTSYI